MPTTHKIARATPTGKPGRPQLFTYPFASMKRGDTFQVRQGHFNRVRLHRFRYYREALSQGLLPVFTIKRTSPKTFTVKREA